MNKYNHYLIWVVITHPTKPPWVSDKMPVYYADVITYQCPNPNAVLAKHFGKRDRWHLTLILLAFSY